MTNHFLDALSGKNKGRPPIWLMRQAGRYMKSYRALRAKHSFLDLCHHPELVTETTLLPIRQFGMDAAILFSDILMLPEAMGFKVRFDEGIGPIIDNPLTEDTPLKLSYDPERQSYLKPAISHLKQELKETPLIGFTGAPFTLACYLIEGRSSKDFRKAKHWIYNAPDRFAMLIEQLTQGVISCLKQQEECDALQLFDSWADLLSPAHFKKYCKDPLSKISAAAKEIGRPLIYFCKGSSAHAQVAAQTGVEAISLDWGASLGQMRKKLPHTALQGNLDPEALKAPRKTIAHMARAMLEEMKGDPGYIFNLGHGILPDTPEDSVAELIAQVKT